MKHLPLLIFLLLAAAFALVLARGRDPSVVPSALIGRPMPAFHLPGLADEDLRGRAAIVNVFASWCASCVAEMPVLTALSRHVPVYGLAYKDKPAALKAWLKKHGNPYAKIGDDATGRTALDWGVSGVPETFVVDARGIIVHKHVGPVLPADVAALLERVQ